MNGITRILVAALGALALLQLALASPSNMGLKSHLLGTSLARSSEKQTSRELEMANVLLQRLLDVAYQTARDFGVQDHELKEVQRKRNIIQACYFQAITCY